MSSISPIGASKRHRRWSDNDFVRANDPFLAYAARCTSSFPIAFEPMDGSGHRVSTAVQTFPEYRERNSGPRIETPGERSSRTTSPRTRSTRSGAFARRRRTSTTSPSPTRPGLFNAGAPTCRSTGKADLHRARSEQGAHRRTRQARRGSRGATWPGGIANVVAGAHAAADGDDPRGRRAPRASATARSPASAASPISLNNLAPRPSATAPRGWELQVETEALPGADVTPAMRAPPPAQSRLPRPTSGWTWSAFSTTVAQLATELGVRLGAPLVLQAWYDRDVLAPAVQAWHRTSPSQDLLRRHGATYPATPADLSGTGRIARLNSALTIAASPI